VSPTDLRKLLAANVRELAEAKGTSLNKLADLAGISRPTMHFLLTARSSVGVDTIAKIADALGEHPSVLLLPSEQGGGRRKRARA
jgi:transcriptional regulator with XRE-family HTH domain